MIASTREEIKNCQHYKKARDEIVAFCDYYAYHDQSPCQDNIRKICLSRYHKVY